MFFAKQIYVRKFPKKFLIANFPDRKTEAPLTSYQLVHHPVIDLLKYQFRLKGPPLRKIE